MSDELRTTEEPFEIEKEYIVTNLETLKVMSDPVRLHILECLVEKASTVKELAKRLGTSTTKLYYHVNIMEEHGLIKVVGQSIVSGVLEKQYRTRAYSFDVDKSLFDLGGNQPGGPLDIMLQVIFDATRDDVRRAIEQGAMKPTEDDMEKRNGMLMRSITRLNKARLREFHERLISLLKEFGTKLDDDHKDNLRDEDQMAYGLTVALFPFPDEAPNSTTIID